MDHVYLSRSWTSTLGYDIKFQEPSCGFKTQGYHHQPSFNMCKNVSASVWDPRIKLPHHPFNNQREDHIKYKQHRGHQPKDNQDQGISSWFSKANTTMDSNGAKIHLKDT